MRDAIDITPETNVRSLGAYYTPGTTASALVQWAIRSGEENILEPSAGAGALLLAAFERANKISKKTGCRATAFDIDPYAIATLNALRIDQIKVRHGDFLQQDPASCEHFDLVLANPPFTRNHSLAPKVRTTLRKKFGTKGAAGVWVYFILHSLSFLRDGGRMASIVPRSAIFTDHGRELLARLCASFSSVGIYELRSKPTWSSYAEEAGAVILAENHKLGSCESYVNGVLNDDGTISAREQGECAAYRTISLQSKPLSHFAQLSIGAVTGRNRVFLLSEADRLAAKIGLDDVLPVVSRRRHIAGLTLAAKELALLAENGEKTWLLAPKELSKAVAAYLRIVPEEDRNSVVWFKKRDPWWKVQVASKHHAIFTYMNDLGPRLIKLSGGIVCTNTLHRVEFNRKTNASQKLSAYLTPISTFGQLAAERLGRAYSGGVLKFELADARRLPILVGIGEFTTQLLVDVDKLLRAGKVDEARAAVDMAFMPSLFGRSWKKQRDELETELTRLRNSRRGIV